MPTADAEAEIRAWGKRFVEAVAAKNLPVVLDMMMEDVVLIASSGPPMIGLDAVKPLYADLFAMFDIKNTAADEDMEVELSGNTAIVWGVAPQDSWTVV